jgi:hypothetical protein
LIVACRVDADRQLDETQALLQPITAASHMEKADAEPQIDVGTTDDDPSVTAYGGDVEPVETESKRKRKKAKANKKDKEADTEIVVEMLSDNRYVYSCA